MGSMNTFIFLGPTLRAEQARQYLDAVYCPPVQLGDIVRVLQRGPSVIGIVDGCFELAPVCYKEILVAMSRGVRVYGAAAMGALRAVELHRFGMVGIGQIFEWYRTGQLEDDDEVASAHGPGEAGFAPLSEAMVNIRDAFQAAVTAGIIPAELASHLSGVAKRLHYPDRTYSRILDLGASVMAPDRRQQLTEFLRGYPALQQRDAVAMLQRIASSISERQAPPRVPWGVERTVYLESLLKEVELAASGR